MEVRTLSSWPDADIFKTLLDANDKYGAELHSPLSPSAMSMTAVDSTYCFAEPAQTIIFLDWDDTLFPTTEILDRWGWPSRPEEWGNLRFTGEQERVLHRWRTELENYLRTATALSDRCVIVTNARKGWVDHCIARFAPDLKKLINEEHGARVVYAREVYKVHQRLSPGSPRGSPAQHADNDISEEEYHEQLMKAKFYAMQKEAKKFYSKYPNQTWKNILSVGDAKYEHDAIQELGFHRKAPQRERLRLKAVVTPVSPLIADLTYRLRLATLLWPAYVHYDGDVDLDMNSQARLHAIADALEMPELRSVIRPTPIREEDEVALDEEFDEVAILVQNRIMD
jgi:hypothetical protein